MGALKSWAAICLVAAFGMGCGGKHPSVQTAADVRHMDPMRVTARRAPDGHYAFESYDARALFRQARFDMDQGNCAAAVERYDRLVEEFGTSRYASASLYNAGLCLQRQEVWGEAAARYERLVAEYSDSPDLLHARFQLAFLTLELHAWEDALRHAEWLLERQDLNEDERLEAMSRKAQALLGKRDLDAAQAQAEEALRFYRIRLEGGRLHDDFFAAGANFVLAESYRLRSQSIAIPEGTVETQHGVLEKRAQFLLAAQRAYFDTMRFHDAYWTSASGYRIGSMYDGFWHAIMNAPVAPPKQSVDEEGLALYEAEYRRELAELVRPLMRHAVNYWELTLRMIERTGAKSEWQDKIAADLDRVKKQMEQPDS